MAALDKFSNCEPPEQDGRFVDNGGKRGGDGDGNWFDEQDQNNSADDDVFGKTEMEQKDDDDARADEAAREEEEGGLHIPTDDNSGSDGADFEDRSLV